MKTTASDVLIDAIHDWGVDVVFGLPGDGINGIMEALRKRADKIRFIQVRHEEAAALWLVLTQNTQAGLVFALQPRVLEGCIYSTGFTMRNSMGSLSWRLPDCSNSVAMRRKIRRGQQRVRTP